jgi:hypothetical protein
VCDLEHPVPTHITPFQTSQVETAYKFPNSSISVHFVRNTFLQLYGYPASADRRSTGGLVAGTGRQTGSGAAAAAATAARLKNVGLAGAAGRPQGLVPSSTAIAEEGPSTSQQGPGQQQQQPQGGGKGPNFVLCIGDDRSDEDMFTSIETMRASPQMMTSEVRCRNLRERMEGIWIAWLAFLSANILHCVIKCVNNRSM